MVGVLFLCVKNMSVFLSVAPVEVVGRAGSVGRSKFPKQKDFPLCLPYISGAKGRNRAKICFSNKVTGRKHKSEKYSVSGGAGNPENTPKTLYITR